MGHIRLGQLPRSRRWQYVIGLIAEGSAPAGAIAQAIAEAADARLLQVGKDPGVAYLYWLLTRVTWHARNDNFAEALRSDGIRVEGAPDGLRFLAEVGEAAAREVRHRGTTTAFTEIALRAFRETLGRAVEQRARTLFGVSGADVQRALRELSTQTQFAGLARGFFSSFLGGVLRFVSSKETSNHVGWTRAFLDSSAAASFEAELGAFAHQTTKILEDFSGEWYSKHNWLGDITPRESQRFVEHALRKLRTELSISQGEQ